MIFPGAGAVQIKMPEGSKLVDLATLPSGHLAIESDCYDMVPAGKPATGSTTSFTTTIKATDPDAPEQELRDEPKHGNVPSALLAVMAKAALHGHDLVDLETSDNFLTKANQETADRPLGGLSKAEVRKRINIISTYKAEELQLVTTAREDGTLKRLMSDVIFMSQQLEIEAMETRRQSTQAAKQHDELVMLQTLWTDDRPSVATASAPSSS